MSTWEAIPDETPIDVSGLIPKHISNRSELSVAEAENIHRPMVKYLAAKPLRRQAPFDLKWVHKLHKEMFGKVWRWAGSARHSGLNLGIAFHQIDTHLQALLDELVSWRDRSDMPVLEQAVRLHHRAVQIHPFLNGNGRWARLLANIWLRQQGHPITVWPDQVGEKSAIRTEYIQAIKAADHGNYDQLISLHARFTAAAR